MGLEGKLTDSDVQYDLTAGTLDELIEIVIQSGARLFVSSVGVPPRAVVERLHANGVLYMNMCGHPKHAKKACEAGADIICAQGSEAGGHVSEIPTSVMVPACADLIKAEHYMSPLTGRPVDLVAAGGICDGRGIAAAFMYGASAVWIGTRFVTAVESTATEDAKQTILDATFDDTIATTVFTGRPARLYASKYIREWETTRFAEQQRLLAQGHIPLYWDQKRYEAEGGMPAEIECQAVFKPMSIASGLMHRSGQTAAEIINEMMTEASERLEAASSS
ncbi:2-nitropropane dioxygenase, partial [Lecanosticta acicola]